MALGYTKFNGSSNVRNIKRICMGKVAGGQGLPTCSQDQDYYYHNFEGKFFFYDNHNSGVETRGQFTKAITSVLYKPDLCFYKFTQI